MAEVDLSEVERYLKIFQENPDSRVFAPLADLYRRLGRLREAEEICREGLLRHPYYAGGKVALAHILLDAGRYGESSAEAEAVVTYYPDNLLARKILIRALGAENKLDGARREFEALKHLAPLMSSDPELEAALQGRVLRRELPPTPRASGVMPAAALQSHERTDWDTHGIIESSTATPPPSLAAQRSQRLAHFVRKRIILEGLLQKLGS